MDTPASTIPEVGYKGRARVPTPKISLEAEERKDENEYMQNLPSRFKIRNYYLPDEVATHNSSDDCWVSFFNQVFDITKLLAANFKRELCDPLVLAAGTDITHWFNSDTREPKTYIDPKTNLPTVYAPTGRYLHIPTMGASSNS